MESLVSAGHMCCGSIVCIIFLCEWGRNNEIKLLRTKVTVANMKNVSYLFVVPEALIGPVHVVMNERSE